jgi:1-acyl-sn-glycerol-3-phosphate acyltransferase
MQSRNAVTRRLRTIPILFLGFVATWFLSPVLFLAAIATDLVRWLGGRTPWMATRLVAFLLAYLTAETVGVIALFITWIGSGFGKIRSISFRTAFAVQKAWAGFLFASVRRLFRLTVEVDGLDAVTPAPFILLARHTSIVDNLLPSHFISIPHDVHVRYVMKDELLVDPALDIAGNRLPNLFVRRGAGDGDREASNVRRLAETLGPDEGILIYPEGTRFTEAKRTRALEILQRRSPELHARAVTWRSVLPPRLGGTLALLEGCAADIVVLTHEGLDGFARVADIWKGAMVGRHIQVRFDRISRSEVPESRSGRAEWLYDIWEGIDGWVTGQSPATEGGS